MKLIFTSGTQALQGRIVNHDPLPIAWYEGCRYSESMTRPPDSWHAPRPEFVVLDNPILAAFRKDEEPRDIGTWLFGLSTFGSEGGFYGLTPISPEQAEHARRVLTRLAALEGSHNAGR